MAAIAVGSAIDLSSSSIAGDLPTAILVGAVAIAASVGGMLVALAVRGGLHLARSRQLAARFVFAIATINVTMLGILGAAPIESHAVMLEMPSTPSSSAEIPLTLWLIIVAALLIPVIVAYVVGRISRGSADAA
jgi:hypothetical protein